MKRIALLVAVAGVAAPTALAQQPTTTAPMKIVAPAQPGGAKPKIAAKPIYDEEADAKQQIAAALKKARTENTRVLIQWGYNACVWCQLLHAKFASDKTLAKELLNEYELVLIDCSGRNKQNLDLAASYGADVRKHGFPYLTVLDASGKALANQETESLEVKGEDGKSVTGEGMGHEPAKVLGFLQKNEVPHQQADAVIRDATDRAKSSGKLVFVHFGAPWCGWCHRLENWLAREDVSALIAKDYVEVKIDEDRMPGASEVESRFAKPAQSGIPWFAFVNPGTGEVVANSTGPKGNIGFPAQDDEIEHFMGMVEKTAKHLGAPDLERLKETLVQEQKKIQAASPH
jgi:thioredoxin-related protein